MNAVKKDDSFIVVGSDPNYYEEGYYVYFGCSIGFGLFAVYEKVLSFA